MAKNGNYRELLAVEVASGVSVKHAAPKIGCSLSHAYHLSVDQAFRARVHELRSESTAMAVGKLSSAASLAVDTLVELLRSAEAKDRLNAAKAILGTLVPLTEFGELRARIDRLENDQLRIAQ